MLTLRSTALLIAFVAPLQAQPDRFSLPACSGPDQELAAKSAFIVCYSSARLAPVWTAYELTPESLHGSAPRPSHFRRDYSLSRPTASESDFRRSVFERGHMVPARDLSFSPAAIADSFLFTNVAPQTPSLNNGKWRQLENAVRKLASGASALYVITGPLYSEHPDTIGPDQVPVPAYFFKVVLAITNEDKAMYAAIVPNTAQQEEGWDQLTTTVEEVERQTALDFFSGLDDQTEHRLETERHLFPVPPRSR